MYWQYYHGTCACHVLQHYVSLCANQEVTSYCHLASCDKQRQPVRQDKITKPRLTAQDVHGMKLIVITITCASAIT